MHSQLNFFSYIWCLILTVDPCLDKPQNRLWSEWFEFIYLRWISWPKDWKFVLNLRKKICKSLHSQYPDWEIFWIGQFLPEMVNICTLFLFSRAISLFIHILQNKNSNKDISLNREVTTALAIIKRVQSLWANFDYFAIEKLSDYTNLILVGIFLYERRDRMRFGKFPSN